jgi:D-aminopeptidase
MRVDSPLRVPKLGAMTIVVRPAAAALLLCLAATAPLAAQERQAVRDFGVVVGVLPTGPHNAITDVAGVLVGQVTIARGDSINTGVTAILPHGGNVFQDKVPAAIVVGNGFGKLVGMTQVQELGELESPVVLTCTLCVPRAADAVLTYLLGLPGNERVRSANPVVGETNDGYLNDIRMRPIAERDVLEASGSRARHGGVRLEGRHRQREPCAAGAHGRLDRRRPGADQLRRRAAD